MSGDVKEPENAASNAVAAYRTAAGRLRTRTDATGKLLGGLGTTAATAAGLAKIGDLFPIPPETWSRVWFALALVGFALAVLALLGVAARLARVGVPVTMSTVPAVMVVDRQVTASEARRVQTIYDRTARLNGAPSLAAYEARQHRLERISRRTPDAAARERLQHAADEIRGDTAVAQASAFVDLLRGRAARATRGSGAWTLYVAFVAGFLLFALGTDYVQSQRTERIAIARSCAEARAAGASAAGLPRICRGTLLPATAAPVARPRAAASP